MSYCYYFLLAFVVARALASPYGAPLAACASMTPLHGFDPQTKESPFVIIPLMDEIMQGTLVPVALSSMTQDYFKGFLVMAFDDYGETIGTFSVDESGNLMNCPFGRNNETYSTNAVTHSTNEDKSFVQLNWMPHPYFTGPVYFRATFVKNVANYWVNVSSSVVNVVPFMPSSGVYFASTSSLMALPLLALIACMF